MYCDCLIFVGSCFPWRDILFNQSLGDEAPWRHVLSFPTNREHLT